jgi:hypothetical protein
LPSFGTINNDPPQLPMGLATLPEPDGMPLAHLQRQFGAHIRDPQRHPAPDGIEDRRMGIYRDLLYRNIEGFIASAFPVLHSILSDDRWHAMVRDFMANYRCDTPYFLEISQEFIAYLQQSQSDSPAPPYLIELAHYEWVELALDVAEAEPDWSKIDVNGDLLAGRIVVSPNAWSLAYNYPVHQIGPGWQQTDRLQSKTYLLVYRNSEEAVKFMELNAVTARLLELVVGNEAATGQQVLEQLAREMGRECDIAFINTGSETLAKLHARGIVMGVRAAALA